MAFEKLLLLSFNIAVRLEKEHKSAWHKHCQSVNTQTPINKILKSIRGFQTKAFYPSNLQLKIHSRIADDPLTVYQVEICMEMGNAGFPSLSWDFHEKGNQIAKNNGNETGVGIAQIGMVMLNIIVFPFSHICFLQYLYLTSLT